MAALHHLPLGWTAKTLANHKSNAKTALIWFAKEKEVLQHSVALSPTWDRLRAELTDPSTRYRLMPLPAMLEGQAWAVRLHRADSGVPYGIALAAAALTVYPHTIWMRPLGL